MNPRALADIPAELPIAPAQGPWLTEALFFTQRPLAEARAMQREAFEKISRGKAPGHQLLIMEHPPTCVVGDGGDSGEIERARERWLEQGLDVYHDPELQGVDFRGPGQTAAYLTMGLERWGQDRRAFERGVVGLLLRVLADFEAEADTAGSIRVSGGEVAAYQTHVRDDVAFGHVVIHTNPDSAAYDAIRDRDGGRAEIATLTELGMPIERQDAVREALVRHYEEVFGSRVVIPQRSGLKTAKPPWLRAKMPTAPGTRRVREIIGDQRLHTVCESARCPNLGECWAHGTATFMINGNVCTRSCSFCAVFTGRPPAIDPDEPRRVAEAARTMGLRYVVVTAVNRDERQDGGAPQFAATIRELRRAIPGVRVEVLIPDFKGDAEALEVVFAERPDVLNHNIETVPRLYRRVRPQARYPQSLDVIRRAKAAGLVAKSGIMLGLGEQADEIEQVLRDLRASGCDILTIGQYLRPSEKHHPIIRYVTPAEFAHWKQTGEALGFTTVESGPLVRSSYHAHDSFDQHATKRAD